MYFKKLSDPALINTTSRVQHYLLIMFLLSLVLVGTGGCKAKKEARARAAEEAEMISKAKSDLMLLLNDDGTLTFEEKEKELARIRALNINDPEINDLIARVATRIEEEKREAGNTNPGNNTNRGGSGLDGVGNLKNYMRQIVSARSNVTANYAIDEALTLFSSEDVPVFIVIHESNGQKDYDQPTTIRKYLEYLKDQKKSNAEVADVVFDENGKIKEVELIKKY